MKLASLIIFITSRISTLSDMQSSIYYMHSHLCILPVQDLIRKQVVQLPSSKVTKLVMEEEENQKRPEYPKPDTDQWLPFKPKILIRKYLGYHWSSALFCFPDFWCVMLTHITGIITIHSTHSFLSGMTICGQYWWRKARCFSDIWRNLPCLTWQPYSSYMQVLGIEHATHQ